MDDFPGLLARDFGFKPQGKSAPMAPPRSSSSGHNNNTFSSSANFGLGSDHHRSSSSSSSSFKNSNNNNKSNSIFDDHDRDGVLFNDVFGGPPRYTSPPASDSRGNAPPPPSSGFDYDYNSIFKDQNAKSSSMPPVFDKPVYDDDIFDGLPGVKSSSVSSNAKYDDVFASISASSPPSKHRTQSSSPFDDLLGNLGKKEAESKSERVKVEKDSPVFDDLLPGFGGSSSNRSTSESSRFQKPASASTKTASSVMDDPFVVLESTSTPAVSSSGMFTEPLEEISKHSSSGNTRVDGSSVRSGVFDDMDPLDSLGKSVPPVSSETNKRGKDQSPLRTGGKSVEQSSSSKVFDDIDPFDSLGKSVPPVSSEANKRGKDRSPLRAGGKSGAQSSASKEPIDKSTVESTDGHSQKRMPVDNFQESHQTLFDMPNVSTDFRGSVGQTASPPPYMNASPNETNFQANTTQRSEEIFDSSDDVWLTVSEIPLFTEPTRAPPPSRPPPPRPTRVSKSETGSFSSTNARKKVNEFSSFPNSTQYTHSPKSTRAAPRSSGASEIDELEDFAMGRARNNVNEHAEVLSGDDVESNSVAAASAAAMKEAMDRAEAKFRHAKEMREREYLKASRSKEAVQQDKDEKAMQDAQDSELREKQEWLDRERQQREREEEERELRRLEKERERASAIEREREQRRLERERIEKERELARQAVERATREARERAATEARLKAERAAVGKVSAEARVRAERAAVQRAQAEARERAAAEARERAEKAAAEARERANAESREKEAREKEAREREARDRDRARAERAAVERAAAEARERAAAAARANQQKNDDDLESFFGMGSRASSAPRPRANSSDPMFDAQSKGVPDATRRTSVGSSSSIKKASSTTNIVDDLTSIFGGAASSSGDFQEVEGESEDRRRARLDRHQRTQERAAKALAEKNQRDLQAQREQAERHRIGETLDVEIKRWSAGKEGNLRALLSTLQYVLWPECGWQPVSLTDLITAAAVKKVYRKATLCIHPDKVQQKGANLQQKYVAEKVFDLLKEAWNKFNSEELF